MEKELTVGIIGFGGAGLAQYGHFNAIEGCRVGAVYDTKPGGLERARKLSHDLLVTDNLDKFLGSGMDVVAVCSPDKTHADYVVESLRADKHVICEKPLTDSIEGCRRIIKAEREAHRGILAVQHQMRFLPVHVKIKELIEKRALGTISYIEGYYVHNLTERASKYDTWRFEDNATPLVYSGCHFVDLLRWVLNDEVVEVAGMANNLSFPDYPESDLNVILLRFRSGIIGKVITAFGAGRPQDHSVRVYGSEKCIENNLLFCKDGRSTVFARPFLEPYSPRNGYVRNKLRVLRCWRRRATLFGRMFEGLMRLYRPSSEYSIAGYPIRLYEHSFAVRAALSNFIESVRDGKRPLCTSVDAAKTVATCLAGVEAYRTGRTIPVKDYWLPEFEEGDAEGTSVARSRTE